MPRVCDKTQLEQKVGVQFWRATLKIWSWPSGQGRRKVNEEDSSQESLSVYNWTYCHIISPLFNSLSCQIRSPLQFPLSSVSRAYRFETAVWPQETKGGWSKSLSTLDSSIIPFITSRLAYFKSLLSWSIYSLVSLQCNLYTANFLKSRSMIYSIQKKDPVFKHNIQGPTLFCTDTCLSCQCYFPLHTLHPWITLYKDTLIPKHAIYFPTSILSPLWFSPVECSSPFSYLLFKSIFEEVSSDCPHLR